MLALSPTLSSRLSPWQTCDTSRRGCSFRISLFSHQTRHRLALSCRRSSQIETERFCPYCLVPEAGTASGTFRLTSAFPWVTVVVLVVVVVVFLSRRKVALRTPIRRARLVLRLVTICRRINYLCNPPGLTHLGHHLMGRRNDYQPSWVTTGTSRDALACIMVLQRDYWCLAEGNRKKNQRHHLTSPCGSEGYTTFYFVQNQAS